MSSITLVAAQINVIVGDIKGNTKKILHAIHSAIEKHHADIIIFPELALTGYSPEDILFRHTIYTICEEAKNKLIQQIPEGVSIIFGMPGMNGEACYNQAIIAQKGKIIATYNKRKLPNDTVFDEERYFTPGDTPCIVTLNNIKVGVIVCEDTWHEEPIISTAQAGAELIISINASPYDRFKVNVRSDMLQKQAKLTQLPIIYVNLVGGQDELVFDGGSMVVDATGQKVQQAGYYQEELMRIEANIGDTVTITPQPIAPHVSLIENIYRALILGTRDYIQKNQFHGALIGLSGGVDSALSLALAVKAIGAQNITAVMMPSKFTSKESLTWAKEQAELLGVDYQVIPIHDMHAAFLTALQPHLQEGNTGTTSENIQARIRGSLLMALSNQTGRIVLTTGNKTELAVGYSTLYGDMAGGFCMLKDIPKTMVYQLCDYCNAQAPTIVQGIIDRAPSAELAANQTDQDTLPPYDLLDELLELYIEQDKSIQQIIDAGYVPDTIKHIATLVQNSEHKRAQAPLGIRTTPRAFGKDRRYPITSRYLQQVIDN